MSATILNIGLAFLEGLLLIASPCILPVLPIVLAASLEGGRKRPIGIIISFIVTFSLFAFLSHKLVQVLHINLSYIKYASLLLLTLFAFIMIFKKLADAFARLTERLANFGGNYYTDQNNGFISGLFIGALIGLVWTPCAGPILAVVLVQIIREQSDIHALLILLGFSLGSGVPMLLIALLGRKLMNQLKFFMAHADLIRKIFGVIILISVVLIASGYDFSSPSASSESSDSIHNALLEPYSAPNFKGIDAWINSPPLNMADLKGKVVLIDFWTYSCINCIRTLPIITKWDQLYRDKGLVIIGVHSPEFEFEKIKSNVEAAVLKYHIQYPVALDNNLDTWTNFSNQYWPAHYLINKEGKVVYTHFGEGEYAETENNIRSLLGLSPVSATAPEAVVATREQTPETYLGYERGENFASPEKISSGSVTNFSLPKFLSNDQWGLSGSWKIESQRIIADEKDAALQINFTASKVFLVLGTPDGETIPVHITLNGNPVGNSAGIDAPNGVMMVKQHRLYELIHQNKVRNGLLEIKTSKPGLEAYAFTFGSD